MEKDLIQTIQKPELPIEWDYQESVKKTSEYVYAWKNITKQIIDELWIAREILSKPGRRTDLGDKSPGWEDYCEAIGSKRNTVNKWLKQWFTEPEQEQTVLIPPPLPENTFRVIVSDPPWPYGTKYDPDTRRVASPYPEMSLDEIQELGVPAADDSALWLWTTHKFIWDARDIMFNWGFEYKLIFVWNKQILGTGGWLRNEIEFCLLGTKGEAKFLQWNLTNQRDFILSAPRREHSRKPQQFYEWIEELCPGPLDETFYCEMFTRTKREGWKGWGNEIGKF
jgi:N6-adenosine-specific RNA methylase IME4